MRYPTNEAEGKFSKLLGIKREPEEQDWEHMHANVDRLNEFIECYHSHAVTDDERFTLMGLILSSFEEHDDLSEVGEMWLIIKAMLNEHYNVYLDLINYYSCLETEKEDELFFITKLMRTLLMK